MFTRYAGLGDFEIEISSIVRTKQKKFSFSFSFSGVAVQGGLDSTHLKSLKNSI